VNHKHSFRLKLLLWIVLVITNAIDIWATQYSLNLGCVELNPLVKLFCTKTITYLAIYKSLLLFVLLLLIPYIKGLTLILLKICCCIYVFVVVYHAINILQYWH
jgi:hypothetical protein